MNTDPLVRYPQLRELLNLFRSEFQKAQLPPDRTILDDEDVMRTLKISKRRLQYMKSEGTIAFHLIGKRSYYLLSDILKLLKENRQEPPQPKF